MCRFNNVYVLDWYIAQSTHSYIIIVAGAFEFAINKPFAFPSFIGVGFYRTIFQTKKWPPRMHDKDARRLRASNEEAEVQVRLHQRITHPVVE